MNYRKIFFGICLIPLPIYEVYGSLVKVNLLKRGITNILIPELESFNVWIYHDKLLYKVYHGHYQKKE